MKGPRPHPVVIIGGNDDGANKGYFVIHPIHGHTAR